MKSTYSFIAVLFLVLLTNSISLADDWVKTSDAPLGTSQFKIETGIDNGSDVQFVVSADGAGLFRSNDGGLNWENIGLVGKGLTAMVDNPSNAGVYIVSASDGVYKTTDGGITWQQYTSGIEGLFVTDIISLGTSTNTLGVGTVGNGVFYSNDGGETWQQSGTGLENKTVTSLEFIINSAASIDWLATTQEDGVWAFGLGTGLWTPINAGNNNLVGTTAIAGDSQGKLYAAISPNICSSPNDPVFWQFEAALDFINTFVVTLDDQVFACSFGDGVWRRTSDGVWIIYSDGLPSDNDGYTDAICMTQDKTNNTESSGSEVYLWVAVLPLDPTIIGGIYRTVNPVTDVRDNIAITPSDLNLEQNYPNPFNPSTSIQYQVSSISQVSLKVYDVLRNKVATLVNESKPAGSYKVEFDASQLSSGIYFYRLQADSFVETKKMTLIK